jgi:hypothetical protein
VSRARVRSRSLLAFAVAFAACHHAADKDDPIVTPIPAPRPSQTERMVALLPDGAQVIVELDLARLRANAAVGPLATSALAAMGSDSRLPGLPIVAAGSPLGSADAVVLAAYGVGTSQAATLTLLATKADVPGGTRVSPEVVAIGPDEWTGQLATRAALDAQHPLAISDELRALRKHAEPEQATGAVLRATARLSFDARVALARITGIEVAPALISVWGDVADDVAVVVDADAVDPGDKAAKDSAKRLAHTIRGLFAEVGDDPLVRGLGVGPSLDDAHLAMQGTWVRATVVVGPRHLARVVERARAMLASP